MIISFQLRKPEDMLNLYLEISLLKYLKTFT